MPKDRRESLALLSAVMLLLGLLCRDTAALLGGLLIGAALATFLLIAFDESLHPQAQRPRLPDSAAGASPQRLPASELPASERNRK